MIYEQALSRMLLEVRGNRDLLYFSIIYVQGTKQNVVRDEKIVTYCHCLLL